jgi:hypothetical protein
VSDQHVRSRLRLLADQVVSDAVERRQIPVSAAKIVLQLPDEEMFGLKERIAQGETLHMADVMAVRERLRANGVINPRFKGGGRASRGPMAPEPAASSGDPGAAPHEPGAPVVPLIGEGTDQTVFDPSARPGDARVVADDQTLFDPSDLADPGYEGMTDGAADEAAHPAVTALLAERTGANLAQALPPESRARLAEALRELERRAPAAQWLADLHRGLRRELGLGGEG